MIEEEKKLVNHDDPLSYNLAPGGSGGYNMLGKTFSKESRQKISNALKGKKLTEERKANMRVPKPNLKGHIKTEAHKAAFKATIMARKK